MKQVKRFDIYWVNLDPTQGREIQKTRPCVVVSPDEMNSALGTVMVVPLTSTTIDWPFRTVVLSAITKERLHKKIGTLATAEQRLVLAILQAIFSR